MATALKTCMICGNRVFASFWACTHCAEVYGLDVAFSEWPAWAKRMMADHTAERRTEREQLECEIVTDPVMLDGMDAEAPPDDPLEGLGDEIQDTAWNQQMEAMLDAEIDEGYLSEDELARLSRPSMAYSTKPDGGKFDTSILRRRAEEREKRGW